MKELKLYLNYLKEEIEQVQELPSDNRLKYFETFLDNITAGMNYYKKLFTHNQWLSDKIRSSALKELTQSENDFSIIKEQMILLQLLNEPAVEVDTPLEVKN
jgi:uncharacterized protein (DUF2342 family)